MTDYRTRINIKIESSTLRVLWLNEQFSRHPGIRYGTYDTVQEQHHSYYETGHRHTESSGLIINSSHATPFSSITSAETLANYFLPIYAQDKQKVAGILTTDDSNVQDRVITLNITDYNEAVSVNFHLINKQFKYNFIHKQLDEMLKLQSLLKTHSLIALEFLPLKHFRDLEVAIIAFDQSNGIK